MIVQPGSTIGIIGGGQLGRMLAIAAAQLGYRCHVYAPEGENPAADVAAQFSAGAFDDAEKLAQFARQVDVATYEFENIPAAALEALEREAPLFPSRRALQTAQDRLSEKEFVLGLGGRPAKFAPVSSLEELSAAIETVGRPAVLKTRRFGYDGKGQQRIALAGDAAGAFEALRGAPSILEKHVAFSAEFSILLCRGRDGDIRIWDAPENRHESGILATSVAPHSASIADQVAEASALARRVAEALDYVGVLTLEFFATADGPVFNEMAPRVHNSGHWTIEGALTSQFENHVRAICGQPLGEARRTATRIEMRNLIGDQASEWHAILSDPAAHLHLYGKSEARAGRKMGHVTRLIP